LIFNIHGDRRGDRAPAVTLVGCWANASFDAAAGADGEVMLLVARRSARHRRRLDRVGAGGGDREIVERRDAVDGGDGERAAEGSGPLATEIVTFDVLLVTISELVFDIDGDRRAIALPAATFVGCCANANLDAAAADDREAAAGRGGERAVNRPVRV
jgi:hypothetical protein